MGTAHRALRSALAQTSTTAGALSLLPGIQSFARGFAKDAAAAGTVQAQSQYKQEVSKLRKSFQEETRKRQAEEEEKLKAQEHARAELRAQRKEVEAARRKEVDARMAAERAEWKEYMVRQRSCVLLISSSCFDSADFVGERK